MTELSVIVPVYRSEAYLSRCLDSILNQSFRDLEVILVDDGSPDRSGQICDAYARQDERVRVIHQENAGVSAARNRGLDAARGAYVGFVDGDDWIDASMYEILLSDVTASGAEIAGCDGLYLYEDGKKIPDTVHTLPENCLLTHETMTPEILTELACSACYRIYSRSFLQERKISFPVGLKFSEDRVFNLRAMGFARQVQYRKQPLYMRYVNNKSCTHSYHADRFQMAKEAKKQTELAIGEAWQGREDCLLAFLPQYADACLSTVYALRQEDCPLSLAQKLRLVRKICRDEDLRQAIEKTGYAEEEGRLILRKQALLLYHSHRAPVIRLLHARETLEQEGLSGVIQKILRKLTKKD